MAGEREPRLRRRLAPLSASGARRGIVVVARPRRTRRPLVVGTRRGRPLPSVAGGCGPDAKSLVVRCHWSGQYRVLGLPAWPPQPTKGAHAMIRPARPHGNAIRRMIVDVRVRSAVLARVPLGRRLARLAGPLRRTLRSRCTTNGGALPNVPIV